MAELEVPETMQVDSVQEEPQHQEGERQLSEREKTMRAIAERAEHRRQEEIAQARIYDEEARDAGMGFDPNEEPSPEPEPIEQVEVTEPAATDPPSPQPMHKVQFEGRSFEVTQEQYDQLVQMGMLANLALSQYQQQPQQPAATPQQPSPSQQAQIDQELVRETVRRIQYGGEQDGAEALTRLIGDVVARQPQIDQSAIIQHAARQAQAQTQFAQDQATIQREYADTIFNDTQRTMLARLNVDAIRNRNAATNKYQTELEIYREAGNMVLDALNLPRPNSQGSEPRAALQAAQVSPRIDVIERKRAAPRHSTTQVDRRSPAPATPRPPSGSEIVDQMRRARGQASMM